MGKRVKIVWMNEFVFLNQCLCSVFLSSDTRETGSVNIFGSGGEHFAEYSQIFYVIQFSCAGEHWLSCESFAHSLGLFPAFGVVDSTDGIVAAFPADGDGGVVAEVTDKNYKV